MSAKTVLNRGKKNSSDAAEKVIPVEASPTSAPKTTTDWLVRTLWSIVMVSSFSAIIYYGAHLALVFLVFSLQVFGFRELITIRDSKTKASAYPPSSFRPLDVMLFCSFAYFFYGSFFLARFSESFEENTVMPLVLRYHTFISFTLISASLMYFVICLKKGFYKSQFKLLIWTVMVLITMSPSTFHILNIFNGIIWFLLPTSLIICNDIMAYVWGKAVGRTPLTELSAKKTWEGFMGAFISTVIFAFYFSYFLGSYQFFTCPKTSLWETPMSCPPDPLYQLFAYQVPQTLREIMAMMGIRLTELTLLPVQIHAITFAIFASTAAPFGGFLASGFKRAFDMKDFGNLIPGHGGIVDRMDCQVLMSLFTFVYFSTFVLPSRSSSWVLDSILALPAAKQVEVYQHLQESLRGAGLL